MRIEAGGGNIRALGSGHHETGHSKQGADTGQRHRPSPGRPKPARTTAPVSHAVHPPLPPHRHTARPKTARAAAASTHPPFPSSRSHARLPALLPYSRIRTPVRPHSLTPGRDRDGPGGETETINFNFRPARYGDGRRRLLHVPAGSPATADRAVP